MNPHGVFATITSLAFMAMGMPVQIYKIYKAKSTKGLSLFERCTLLLTTLAWCEYSFSLPDKNWYILIANAPGAAFAFIILCQFWLYRHNNGMQNGSGFWVSKEEMQIFRIHGRVCLKNRGMVGPPYVGETMDLASEDNIIKSGTISHWEALPQHGRFNITFEKTPQLSSGQVGE